MYTSYTGSKYTTRDINYQEFNRDSSPKYNTSPIDIGLLFATKNYHLIKSVVSTLHDCEKDSLITKYIDGDLIVLKALLDAGACYLCDSVRVITN